MDFFRLSTAHDRYFADAFALYEESFPMRERRPADKQKALMKNPLYHFDVIAENNVCLGIIMYWDCSEYTYVEHFAVNPSMRGKAVGSGILGIFCKGRSLVVLEIDPPADDISVRRERFYQRLGFVRNEYKHLHMAYRKQFPPHELIVMSHPRLITEKEYKLFQRELSETVMKDAAD